VKETYIKYEIIPQSMESFQFVYNSAGYHRINIFIESSIVWKLQNYRYKSKVQIAIRNSVGGIFQIVKFDYQWNSSVRFINLISLVKT